MKLPDFSHFGILFKSYMVKSQTLLFVSLFTIKDVKKSDYYRKDLSVF